jgi:hypothetical protein
VRYANGIHRVFCEVCGRELAGAHHAAVLLIDHHTHRHAGTVKGVAK